MKNVELNNKDVDNTKNAEINTQKLEEEIKEQMKKFVVVDEKN